MVYESYIAYNQTMMYAIHAYDVTMYIAAVNMIVKITSTIPIMVFPAYISPKPGIMKDNTAAKIGFFAIFYYLPTLVNNI